MCSFSYGPWGCSPPRIFQIAIFGHKNRYFLFGQNHLIFVQAMEKKKYSDKRLPPPPPTKLVPYAYECVPPVVRLEWVKLMKTYIVSWEPEGRYHYWKMFRWEPEWRYHDRLCAAIAAFWFSTEHSLNIDSALLALTWTICGCEGKQVNYADAGAARRGCREGGGGGWGKFWSRKKNVSESPERLFQGWRKFFGLAQQ